MSVNLTVRFNQALSFSPLLSKTAESETVFWPGCSAMKMGSGLMNKTHAVLKDKVPNIGFSSWCCAKPTFAVGSEEQKAKRASRLHTHFRDRGIKAVYTLCPNCKRTMADKFNVQVLSAWPLLADYAERVPLAASAFGGAEICLHDPCASRDDAESQSAARRILTARRVRFKELAHNGERTRCCGRRDMLFLTNPPAARKMLDARLSEASGDTVFTYCESCAEAFRGAGRESRHLLEVLFNKKAPRSFLNRVVNTWQGVQNA